METVNFENNVIDCKAFVENLQSALKNQVCAIQNDFSVSPTLALIRIEGDPASEIYVNNKVKLCEKLGIKSKVILFPNDVSQDIVEQAISELNADVSVNGILLQLPLPKQLNSSYLTNLIDPLKDVDGLTLINQGHLFSGGDGLFPCTPSGVISLLKHIHGNLDGLNAAVIGRSLIVGQPMAQLLQRENCTVTVLHSHSKSPELITSKADIVVAAVGKPKFVTKEWIKSGATVIDVGINRILLDNKPKIVGDVDFENVKSVAGYITKVPGGVGPITVTFLMENTLKAFRMQKATNALNKTTKLCRREK